MNKSDITHKETFYHKGRPTFMIKCQITKTQHLTIGIKSGGLLCYRYHNKSIQLLLAKYDNVYGDIGGKSSKNDTSIFETILREVGEETNNILTPIITKELLNRAKYFYKIEANHSSYMVGIVELKMDVKPDDFGPTEIFLDKKRTIEWIDYDKFLKMEVNGRLVKRVIKNYFEKKLIY